jgi:hypothetical protein
LRSAMPLGQRVHNSQRAGGGDSKASKRKHCLIALLVNPPPRHAHGRRAR